MRKCDFTAVQKPGAGSEDILSLEQVAKVEVARGGEMSRVGTGKVGAVTATGSWDGGCRVDMEQTEVVEAETGSASLVNPRTMKALVTVSADKELIL